MKHKCPICKKHVNTPSTKDKQDGRFFPFCCERCKLIDLGAWFDADYRIIAKPDDAEQGSLPPD